MRKIEKIYIAVVTVFIVLIVGLVAAYDISNMYDNQEIQCNLVLSTSEKETYELYYSTENKGDKTEFSADYCSYAKIDKEKEAQGVTFDIAAGTKVLRLDPGSEGADVFIYEMTLMYKGRTHTIPLEKVSEFVNSYCVEVSEYKDGALYIKTVSGDPYIVMDITEYNVMPLIVRDIDRNYYRIGKGAVALLFVFAGALAILKRKKILSYFGEIYKNRKLLWSLSKNDFKTKYSGSYLGIIWAFVQPIVTVCVYWFVFSVGLRAGKVSKVPYALWLVSGLVPWFFINDTLMGGTNALLEYNYLVKKVVFNINILPIVKTISACFVHIFFVGFTIIMYACSGYYPDIYYLQLIYYSVCAFVLLLGLVYITCSVVVFFRDLTQIINIFLQIGIWLTPIMWQVNILPSFLKWIFYLNPFYYIVLGYRDSLIDKVSILDRWGFGLYFWALTLIVFVLGNKLFKRLQVHFADVL